MRRFFSIARYRERACRADAYASANAYPDDSANRRADEYPDADRNAVSLRNPNAYAVSDSNRNPNAYANPRAAYAAL